MFDPYIGPTDEDDDDAHEKAPSESWKGSQEYLEQMQFPANKKTLLEQAADIRAPADLVDFLSRVVDKTYHSLEDLWESAKKAINH
ncbi:MAG: DUF2795 domain-containing protein [Alphaproteobacteria bacterium]|jgi:hypothetical protein